MSKRDYYEVLGVARTATEDDIKKAYRKLSSAHHPDKHTTAPDAEKAENEAKFKEAKEAYEMLSDISKRAAYDHRGHGAFQGAGWQEADPSEMGDIMEQLRRARGGHPGFHQFKQVYEFNASVSLADAYKGFEVEVQLPDHSKHKVKVGPGTPEGYRTLYEVNQNHSIIAVTRIKDKFLVKDPTNCGFTQVQIDGRPIVKLEVGDVETVIEIDAIDMILGAWVDISDFLGEQLKVRVPQGFQVNQRLKVKGKGYVNWLHELKRPDDQRADLYIRVVPVFNPPSKIDRTKIVELELITRPT